MARVMLPFLTKQLQPFNAKGFPPLVLGQSRTAATAGTLASYSDGAYFGTGAPSYAGNTVSITATHAGSANNVSCIFLHYSAGLIISGITLDGAAATIVTVSFATSPQGVVAYAPCPSGGSHTWAVTFTSTPSAGSVQGTTVTMTGVTSAPSQTSVQSWNTYNPETTGSITVSAGGIAMTFLASASTGGTWTGAAEITTTSASFPLAYSNSSGTVSYAVAGSGSQMATLSWDAATAGTHDTTGVLTGPGSMIVGAAVYNAIHPTSGVLTGPGSTIVGSAARTREHATTGILTGPGSTIVGVAVYNAKHDTSGVLTGPGSVVVGAAARTREHATAGVLTGPGSTIVGVAVYNAKHATSGALTGPGSTIAGTAARTGTAVVSHATSGALVGQPSIIDGTARRTRQHTTSGILTGPPALIVGVVTRWRDHDSTGALLGVTGVVFGRGFNGTPQLHDIPVDSDNLVNEPPPPAEDIGAITEPSGQIVNHPPYPAA